MLRHILVPVDGSELSERALPYAALIARAQRAKVTLIRALEIEHFSWSNVSETGFSLPENLDPEIHTVWNAARDHLLQQRDWLIANGVNAEAALRGGQATSVLLDIEHELTPDLCIMATHGRSGLARFALGSVADRLLREGTAPELMIPAFASAEPRFTRAVLPLDGSPLAEQTLPLVEALAGKPLASARLLMALGDHTVRLPSHPEHEATEPQATEYLDGVATRLTKAGISVDVSVVGGHAVEAIEAAAADADVVIMSTHGRGGLDRWRHGSVAERATRHTTIPRLLVRVH